MSLINDALRRAGQIKKPQPPDSSDGAPMQPVYPSTSSKNSFLGPILLVVIALVMTVAGWFFWKGWQAKSKPDAVAKVQAPSSPAQREAVAESKTQPKIEVPTVVALESTKDSAPVAVTENIPPPTANVIATESKNTAPTESSTNVVATVVTSALPPAATPPELKLQGIFYRINNPTALINGKTLGVGEKIDGARVVKISPEQVTVERNGQTNVLMMR